MGFTCCQAGQGFLTQQRLGSPPPGESPNFPSVMGFPTGHFLAVTSGTHISPCAPPFLAGTARVGQAGSLHKGWHGPPFVHLRYVCRVLRLFMVWNRDLKRAPNNPKVANSRPADAYYFQCLREHERPSCLVVSRFFCAWESTEEP